MLDEDVIRSIVITDLMGTDQMRVTFDSQSAKEFIFPMHEPIPTSSDLRYKLKGAGRFYKVI